MAKDYEIAIDRERCLDCAACVGICPPSALLMVGLTLRFDRAACVACDDCVIFCPVGALRAVRSASSLPGHSEVRSRRGPGATGP